jgi:hypothetical protein
MWKFHFYPPNGLHFPFTSIGQRKQPTREGKRDDNDGTIVGSNGFVRRLKQQSTNKGGTRGEMVATDSGGEEHDDNDGEPTSTHGAIADEGDRAGEGGGGRGGGVRDYDNVSREEGWMRGRMRNNG